MTVLIHASVIIFFGSIPLSYISVTIFTHTMQSFSLALHVVDNIYAAILFLLNGSGSDVSSYMNLRIPYLSINIHADILLHALNSVLICEFGTLKNMSTSKHHHKCVQVSCALPGYACLSRLLLRR